MSIVDQLEQIKHPISKDLVRFNQIFDEALQHPNAMLSAIFQHILQRKGKLMRPTLLLLVAREFGEPTDKSYLSAVMLEMLHTASLVHDDIVDESNERRGQASVNAIYGNKVAVLVGDYLLSTSLEKAAQTQSLRIINHVVNLGKQLSSGEVIQLSNTYTDEFSEEAYYDIIRLKTASLFAVTAELGAVSVDADEDAVKSMNEFGLNLGMCFQIRDDIFDYFDNNKIGKPTGNDMHEGKLTLPVLSVLNQTDNEEMKQIAREVKKGNADKDAIAKLVEFTKTSGGIEYAEKRMYEYAERAIALLKDFKHEDIREALTSYVNFIVNRNL